MSKLNAVDRVIAWLSPDAGVRRLAARRLLASYEAAKPSRLRKFRTDTQGPNTLVATSASALRAQARYLERNHDIARGILRTIVNNVVGPNGVGVEFQPKRPDGSIHEAYASQLTEAYRDWCRVPEVTHELTWSRAQRMALRSMVRDGEVFAQRLMGPVATLDHGTRVPYSIELIEADLVPHEFNDEVRGIAQGIERNSWGRRTGLHLWKGHPLEGNLQMLLDPGRLKRIPWSNVVQLAMIDRIGQLRGVSEFASIITRLEDIKDYEESERIAAKVSAMLTAYVKRHAPDGGGYEGPNLDANNKPVPRQLSLSPGTIIDTLAVGEEIGLIDSNRPNPNLVTWRAGQLRAAAAGIGASYSSISRNYDGTYSAQRQEMVEQYVNYATLCDEFVGQFVQPIVEDFIRVAHMSGVARMPADLKPMSEDDVLYVGQAMPWIDPLKEANGYLAMVRAGFMSEPEVIRRRGGNPSATMEQSAKWREQARERGLVFDSDAAHDSGSPQPTDPADAPEDTGAPGA